MAQSIELKERIDELAMRLVMADCEGPAAALSCLNAVQNIRDCAAREQVPAGGDGSGGVAYFLAVGAPAGGGTQ